MVPLFCLLLFFSCFVAHLARSCLCSCFFQDDDEDVVSIALEDIVVGEEYEGVVNNVVTYGAFVDIGTEVCRA